MGETTKDRILAKIIADSVDGRWIGTYVALSNHFGIDKERIGHMVAVACGTGAFRRVMSGNRHVPSVLAIAPDAAELLAVGRQPEGADGPPERSPGDNLLIELWKSRLSTSQIGVRMGRSKNAIVGRAHRMMALGLIEPRESPIVRNGDPKPRPISRVTGPTLPPLASLSVPVPDFVVSAPPRTVVPARAVREPPRVVERLTAAPVSIPRPWPSPTPRPSRPTVATSTVPVAANRATIRWWAGQRGIDGDDLDRVNRKRIDLGLAPFVVEMRA